MVTWAKDPPDDPLVNRPGLTATTDGLAAPEGTATWPWGAAAEPSSDRSLANGVRLEGITNKSGDVDSCRLL